MGDTSKPYTQTHTPMENKKDLNTWLESLLEWLDSEDKTLYQAGPAPSLVDTPIILITPTKAEALWFADRDISTYGNLRHMEWSTQESDSEGLPIYTTNDITIQFPSAPTQKIKRITDPIVAKLKEAISAQCDSPTTTPISEFIIPVNDYGHKSTLQSLPTGHSPN
jgi:hypothetical protein